MAMVLLLHTVNLALTDNLALALGAALDRRRGFRRFLNAGCGGGQQGRGRQRRFASFALANRMFFFGEAAFHARVINRRRVFGVDSQQEIRASEEGVVAVVADRKEVVDAVTVPGGDQVDAAAGASAAADPLRLPLVDILQFVGIAGDQSFGRLEEGAAAVGAKVGDHVIGREGLRLELCWADRLQARFAGSRREGGITGDAVEFVVDEVVAIDLDVTFSVVAGQVCPRLEEQGAAAGGAARGILRKATDGVGFDGSDRIRPQPQAYTRFGSKFFPFDVEFGDDGDEADRPFAGEVEVFFARLGGVAIGVFFSSGEDAGRDEVGGGAIC